MKFKDLENIVQKLKRTIPEDAEVFLTDGDNNYINLGDISTGVFAELPSAQNEIEVYETNTGEMPNCVVLYPDIYNDID